LTEDSYGVVQRDVPRIVEALVSFLIAIEEYRAELVSRYPPPSPEEVRSMSAKELAEKHDTIMSLSRASDILSEVEDRKFVNVDLLRSYVANIVTSCS
jgi:nucleoporin NDC1